jgi:hypothetical protein
MFISPTPSGSPTNPTLAAQCKSANLYFQQLAHSSQFHFPSNSLGINRSRTLCPKHRGVGIPALLFYPSIFGGCAGLTGPSAADTIGSLALLRHFGGAGPIAAGGSL